MKLVSKTKGNNRAALELAYKEYEKVNNQITAMKNFNKKLLDQYEKLTVEYNLKFNINNNVVVEDDIEHSENVEIKDNLEISEETIKDIESELQKQNENSNEENNLEK
jgi:hypothetical protein